MDDWRRVSGAYVDPPPEWNAHLKWSARIQRYAGDDVPDPEMRATLDSEDRERQTQRPIGRRIPLAARKHPDQQEPALFEPDISIRFKTKQGIDLRLGRFRVFATGVSFQLIARTPDPCPDQNLPTGPGTMNLSSRIRPGQPHRVRLIVSVAPRRGQYGFYGGAILSNTSSPYDFPENQNAPWLAGGSDRRGRVDNEEIELAASYFLSPVPTKGQLVFTIAYPEFGIAMTNLLLDAAQFDQKTSD